MIHYISIVDSNISLDIATEPQTVPIVEIIEAPQEDVIILPEASNEGFNKNGKKYTKCNEVTRKCSRWRKNSVLSPSRARKLARSRLPQPRPPNPPRNPCLFRPTIPGPRAEQRSRTATAASQRPRAATEPRTAQSLQSSFRFRLRSQFRSST
jgi:hypothetical protein